MRNRRMPDPRQKTLTDALLDDIRDHPDQPASCSEICSVFSIMIGALAHDEIEKVRQSVQSLASDCSPT